MLEGQAAKLQGENAQSKRKGTRKLINEYLDDDKDDRSRDIVGAQGMTHRALDSWRLEPLLLTRTLV